MVLPVVKHPTYTKKIDRLGEVKFRNFIAEEHKALMTANELGDQEAVFDTIMDIVSKCIINKDEIDVDSMSGHEIEFMFLQIYIKSVQSKLEVQYKCDGEIIDEDEESNDCDAEFNLVVPIDDAYIKTPENYDELSEIKISDNILIKLSKPSAKQQKKLELEFIKLEDEYDTIPEDENETSIRKEFAEKSNVIDMKYIYSNIDYIEDITTNERTLKSDLGFDEFCNWFDMLPAYGVKAIMDYVTTSPMLYYEYEIKCPKCGKTQLLTFEGISSFFA